MDSAAIATDAVATDVDPDSVVSESDQTTAKVADEPVTHGGDRGVMVDTEYGTVEVHHIVTEEEKQIALENTLKSVGLTYEELKAQAKTGRWCPWDASLAWQVVKFLGK